MSSQNSLRAKNMMYVQQVCHLPAKTMDDLTELVKNRLKPQKYAVILHDKDNDEKGIPETPHIHMMMSFNNARSIKNIAKTLGDKTEYIEVWKGDSRNGYAYLIHATDGARHKHQYNADEVKANFDYPAMVQKMSQEMKKMDTYGDNAKIKTLLNLLFEGKITKEEVENQLTGQQYAKANKQIEAVFEKYLQREAEIWRKQMVDAGKSIRVIWIYGAAGTGKTRFARAYAEKEKQKYYVSGSSRDIFQNYRGEHIMILDELRPHTIPYHDLLRVLDPFGIQWQVMAPSRYTDKVLAVELIIITSPYDPVRFYKEEFYNKSEEAKARDTFYQLERRITLTIEMTEDEIFSTNYKSFENTYVEDVSTSRPNPYSATNCPVPAVTVDDIYNSMFD